MTARVDDGGRTARRTAPQPCGFFAFRAPALPTAVLTAWAEGVEAPGAGRLAVPLETLATTYAHMWLNRLCRADNRLHEYVIYALRARVHEACAAVSRAR